MKDAYSTAFFDVVRETQLQTGYELPVDLEAYVVMLLSSFVEKIDYLPEKSFAEAYLRLEYPGGLSAKELGDTCLFVTGVFPTYGRKHGLNRRYFQDIGIGSYEMVAEVMNQELFTQLATHFNFLSNFIEITTHSPKHELNSLFR